MFMPGQIEADTSRRSRLRTQGQGQRTKNPQGW